ncbi:efflux RND transporter periplasmic adaptor subunit [Thiovibrio sp. JS02]
MSPEHKATKILLPIAIILAGLVVTVLLIKGRPAPAKKVETDNGALVQLLTVKPRNLHLEIEGTGTVQPRQEVSITPQISGRVDFVDPRFVAGGFFQEGELFFTIEAADYALAVERARAALAQAEVALATAQGRAKIARLEWEQLKNQGQEANPLVLHEPQRKEAEAVLASARAALRQAELDLDRTRLTAPFNCRIRNESIDLGQYVKSGTGYAAIAGTDAAEIVVPLALPDMAWLNVPRAGQRNAEGEATVLLTVSGREYSWPGRLVRSLGEADVQGRMSRVVVEVPEPYADSADQPTRPELAPNTFVRVRLRGRALKEVFTLPRSALREGDTVWLMDRENKLRIRPVQVLRLEKERVLLGKGLSEGDRVVLTYLSGAADGMRLRPLEEAGR